MRLKSLRRIKNTEKKLHSHRQAFDKILLFLERLKKVAANPDDLPAELKTKYEQVIKTKARLEEAIANMKKAIESNMKKVDEPMDANIIVHNTMHRGVRISFGKSHFEPDYEQSGVKIFFDRQHRQIKVEKEFLSHQKREPGETKRDNKLDFMAPRKETGRL